MRDHGMREHTKLSFEDFSRTCASAGSRPSSLRCCQRNMSWYHGGRAVRCMESDRGASCDTARAFVRVRVRVCVWMGA